MFKLIAKFTFLLIISLVTNSHLFAQTQTQQTADNKISNHEAVCDGALELIPSTMKFERKRYVKTSPRPVKPKKRK